MDNDRDASRALLKSFRVKFTYHAPQYWFPLSPFSPLPCQSLSTHQYHHFHYHPYHHNYCHRPPRCYHVSVSVSVSVILLLRCFIIISINIIIINIVRIMSYCWSCSSTCSILHSRIPHRNIWSRVRAGMENFDFCVCHLVLLWSLLVWNHTIMPKRFNTIVVNITVKNRTSSSSTHTLCDYVHAGGGGGGSGGGGGGGSNGQSTINLSWFCSWIHDVFFSRTE